MEVAGGKQGSERPRGFLSLVGFKAVCRNGLLEAERWRSNSKAVLRWLLQTNQPCGCSSGRRLVAAALQG